MYTSRREWEIVNKHFKKITEQVKMQTIFQAALQCEIKSQLIRLHHLLFLDSEMIINDNVILHTSKILPVLPKTTKTHQNQTTAPRNKNTKNKTQPKKLRKRNQPKKPPQPLHTVSTMCNSSKCKISD